MKFRLFKTNQFKRSYKKLKLTDEEDLLLIYKIEDDILKLVDIGSHSELFE